MVLDQRFNHTPCVGYFTELISGLFGNSQVNQNRHYVLAILLDLFRYNYVTNQLKNNTLGVS